MHTDSCPFIEIEYEHFYHHPLHHRNPNPLSFLSISKCILILNSKTEVWKNAHWRFSIHAKHIIQLSLTPPMSPRRFCCMIAIYQRTKLRHLKNQFEYFFLLSPLFPRSLRIFAILLLVARLREIAFELWHFFLFIQLANGWGNIATEYCVWLNWSGIGGRICWWMK